MEGPPIKTIQPRDYMGTTWHSMWESVGVGCSHHHKAQEGALSGLDGANNFGETLAGTLQAM
jgi:hypothetical protein